MVEDEEEPDLGQPSKKIVDVQEEQGIFEEDEEEEDGLVSTFILFIVNALKKS